MNNKYSVACITLVRDKYKINTDGLDYIFAGIWYIRPIRFENSIRNRIGGPIRFEIRFERKKTIRRSLICTHFLFISCYSCVTQQHILILILIAMIQFYSTHKHKSVYKKKVK